MTGLIEDSLTGRLVRCVTMLRATFVARVKDGFAHLHRSERVDEIRGRETLAKLLRPMLTGAG
jgi:hypothetical protein